MTDNQPTTYNLLFVCTGNTCRSPLAEAIARHILEQRNWSHVQVASAGIAAAAGSPASDGAMIVADEHGIPLDQHVSQQLTPQLVTWADLVLAMSPSHLMAVSDFDGAEKASLVSDFLDGDEIGTAIEDPYGGDVDAYRATFVQLERAVQALLDRLEPILAP